MSLAPRNRPLAVLAAGLLIMAAFSIGEDLSAFTLGFYLLVFGSSLAATQLLCGFALQWGRHAVSRSSDPFAYWLGLALSSLPFAALGLTILLAAFI